MKIREESGLKFGFPDGSDVVKFDDTLYYRNEFNALPGSKGVDFISDEKDTLSFIEVKNCMGNEGNNRWRIMPNNSKRMTTHTTVDVEDRDSLDIEVPQKVAMTLAALSGVKSYEKSRTSVAELKGITETSFSDKEKKKYVILFLEGDFGSHTRSKKMIMGSLQQSMKTKMRWLNCRVSVVDSDTYDKKIFEILKLGID